MDLSLPHTLLQKNGAKSRKRGGTEKKKKERKETNINLARGPYDHVSYTEQGRFTAEVHKIIYLPNKYDPLHLQFH